MTVGKSVTLGLFAAWLAHDLEEWFAIGPWSWQHARPDRRWARWTGLRWLRTAVSDDHVHVGITIVGILVGTAAIAGDATGDARDSFRASWRLSGCMDSAIWRSARPFGGIRRAWRPRRLSLSRTQCGPGGTRSRGRAAQSCSQHGRCRNCRIPGASCRGWNTHDRGCPHAPRRRRNPVSAHASPNPSFLAKGSTIWPCRLH
jgi:hypothetical protein